mgnify:CR=1 FL=1
MNNLANKSVKSHANLYFVGSFFVLAVSIATLLLLLKFQNQTNLQANLFLSNANSYKQEVKKQQLEIKNLIDQNSKLVTSEMSNFYASELRLTDLTRYFDEISSNLRANGSLFEFTTITYSDYKDNYLPASLSFKTNDTNLLRFLRIIEQSGITEKSTSYLYDLSNISINVSPDGEYNISMGLKIYNFYE